MDRVSEEFEFEVSYLPFELNPDMPKNGLNQKEHLTKKFGGAERYRELTQHVRNVAADEGLHFDFEKQLKTPNTRDAHRIIWFPKNFGKQEKVKEAFLKAYFEEGVDLTVSENLILLAAQAGLDKALVEKMLNSDEGKAEVQLIHQMNHQRKISGVPFFIINNKYGVSGAQASETFVGIFSEVAASA